MGRGKGKKPLKEDDMVECMLDLPDEMWEELERIGDGDRNRGMQIVCEFHAEKKVADVKEPTQGFTDATWDFLRGMGGGSCSRGFEAVSRRYFKESNRVPIASGSCM